MGNDPDAWEDVIGRHGIGRMNENGQRLLEFCANHSLCLPGSYFAGSLRSKVTWMHPRSKHWHQLDHIIVRRNRLHTVMKYRSMHSADCDTDHALVRCSVKLVPKKIHSASPKPAFKLNTTLMQDNQRVADFRQKLSDLDLMSEDDSPNGTWSRLKDCVTTAASDIFGPCNKKQPDWFRANLDLLLPALAEKRSTRMQLLQNNDDASRSHYQAAKSNVRRLTRQASERYWRELSDRVEHCANTGDIRGMYGGISEALGPTPKKTAPLSAADGTIITDLPGQLARWVEHYSLLYANPVEADLNAIAAAVPQMPTLVDLDCDITFEEIERSIKVLKNNKAPGSDGIPPELMKCGGAPLVNSLHHLYQC